MMTAKVSIQRIFQRRLLSLLLSWKIVAVSYEIIVTSKLDMKSAEMLEDRDFRPVKLMEQRKFAVEKKVAYRIQFNAVCSKIKLT